MVMSALSGDAASEKKSATADKLQQRHKQGIVLRTCRSQPTQWIDCFQSNLVGFTLQLQRVAPQQTMGLIAT